MNKYLCQKCKFNNNGWCSQNGFNGLKKKNIQDCTEYKIKKEHGAELNIRKDVDHDNREHLVININGEEVFIPTKCITDFIEDSNKQSVKIVFEYTD